MLRLTFSWSEEAIILSEHKEKYPDFVQPSENQVERIESPTKKQVVEPRVLEATTRFLFVTADTSVIS